MDLLTSTGVLLVDGASAREVPAGKEESLRVRYIGGMHVPLGGVEVEFGILGAAEGASLRDTRVVTNDEGYAETILIAGRTPTEFTVRASAYGALAKFDIEVLKVIGPVLSLGVSYAGKRPIDSLSISVADGMDCNQLRTKGAEVTHYLASLDDRIEQPFGVNRSYAVAAWGSDTTNSKLAWGCVNLDVDEDTAATLIVAIEDLSFMVVGSYAVTFNVDVTAPLGSLAPRARALVAAGLPKNATPQASYLLDVLATKVSFAAARQSLQLDALLEAALQRTRSGPSPFAEALAAAVAEDGATLSLPGVFAPSSATARGSFTYARLLAIRSGDIAKEINASALPSMGIAELTTSYDDAYALVRIESLKIPLGFGSYAAYLLDAVGQQPEQYARRLSASTGCVELGALVAANAATFGAFSPADAVTACQVASGVLVSAIRAEWIALDAQRGSVVLTGEVSVHDRSGDTRVDELGPAARLSGNWVTDDADASAETRVAASVRLPVQSALTL